MPHAWCNLHCLKKICANLATLYIWGKKTEMVFAKYIHSELNYGISFLPKKKMEIYPLAKKYILHVLKNCPDLCFAKNEFLHSWNKNTTWFVQKRLYSCLHAKFETLINFLPKTFLLNSWNQLNTINCHESFLWFLLVWILAKESLILFHADWTSELKREENFQFRFACILYLHLW